MNLEKMFPKKIGKYKDFISVIRKNIAKIIDENSSFLDSIESFLNLDNIIENLIKIFHEKYDNEYNLKFIAKSFDDLDDVLKYEFIRIIPRKYCIKHNDLSGSHCFFDVSDIIDKSPEIEKFILKNEDVQWYIGYKNKKPLYLKYYKDTLKESIPYNVLNYKNDDNPLFYTTKDKDKINNLSFLIFDFMNQKEKRILLFDVGTGFGKSYSINEFSALCIRNKYYYNNINHIIYVTDRKNNVRQEYDDFIKKYPDLKNETLLILSNEDTIIENLEELQNFPEELKCDYYKSLITIAKMIKDSKNKQKLSEFKIIFNEKEQKYREFLRKKLDSIFKDNKIFTYEEKIEFLKNSKEYSCVLGVFSNILIKDRKILFVNNDKFYLPIDIIVESGSVLFNQNKSITNNSVIILDESDASAEKFLERICEECIKTEIDIIEKTKLFYHGFSQTELPLKYCTEDIEEIINDANSEYNRIIEKYHMNYNIAFKNIDNIKNDNWLFIKNNKYFVHTKNSKNEYVMNFDKSQRIVYLEILTEDNIHLPKYNDFIEDLSKLYRKYQRIVKKISSIEMQTETNEDINQLTAVKRVLGIINMSNDQKSRDFIAKDISIISKEEYNSDGSDDFYLNPGRIIRTVVDVNEPDNIKINSYNLQSTPENYIRQLIKGGAYIIFSSATSRNISKLKNYFLNWEKIKDLFYEHSEHAEMLELNYIREREKYVSNINTIIGICPEANIEEVYEYEKIILSYYPDDKKEKVYSLLKELKNKIEKNKCDNDLTQTEKNCDYHYKEYFSSIIDILYKSKNDVLSNLMLLNFNLKNDEFEVIKTISALYDKNVEIFSANVDEIEDTLKKIEECINNNQKCCLYTTYAAAAKGYNFKFSISKEKYELIPINDSGKKELEDNDKIKIDLDGIYLGNITYSIPSINKENRTFSVLKNIYYACSLFNKNEKAIETAIEAILSGNSVFPLKEACKGNNYMYSLLNEADVAKIVSIVQQSVGRGSRCNVRLKNKYITMSKNLIEKICKCDINKLVSEKTFSKQSSDVKKTIKFIENYSLNINKNRINKKAIIEKTNNAYLYALEENDKKGNPSYLKNLQKNLNKLFVTEDEYCQMADEIKMFYIKAEKFLISGYSYDSDEEDMYGNKKVDYLYQANKKKYNVSFNYLDLNESQLKILENYNISIKRICNNGYIILPKGFDALLGNIGESLAHHYFKECLDIYLEDLPDCIYEKMDFVKEYDNYILAVDAKYYNVHSEEYDDEKKLKDTFDKKLKYISNYYGKKVIGIELNTKNINNNNFSIKKHDLSNNNVIITVPNIYKNNEVDYIVFDNIQKIINKEV